MEQWIERIQTFLGIPKHSAISRTSNSKLEEVLRTISGTKPGKIIPTHTRESNKLIVSLNNTIQLNRLAIPISLVNYLKEELNFANTEFIIKKKSGRNTFGTERYFRLVEETDNKVIVPKGFAGKLLRFCKQADIAFEFNDERKKKEEIHFQFQTALREYQTAALAASSKKDMGVIVAPSGSGKTIIGLKIEKPIDLEMAVNCLDQ